MTNKFIYIKAITLNSRFICLLILAYFVMSIFCVSAWADKEIPIELPKTEGSKNFDLEIGQINSQGVNLFKQNNYDQAVSKFNKAVNLANQLRSPGKGILYYNLALSLHESGKNKQAVKSFYSARRFARGNERILKSELLKLYECGLNPSVLCEAKVPLSMNIEGSN